MANDNPIPEMSALAVDGDETIVRDDFNAWLTYGGLDVDCVLRLCKVPDISKIDDYMARWETREEWDAQERKVIIHSKILYPDGYCGATTPEEFAYLSVKIGDADHHFKVAEYDTENGYEDYISSLQALGLHPASDEYGSLYVHPIEYDGEDAIPAPVSDQAQKIIDALADLSYAELHRICGKAGTIMRDMNAPKCPIDGKQLRGRFKKLGMCQVCEKESQKALKEAEKKGAAGAK